MGLLLLLLLPNNDKVHYVPFYCLFHENEFHTLYPQRLHSEMWRIQILLEIYRGKASWIRPKLSCKKNNNRYWAKDLNISASRI